MKESTHLISSRIGLQCADRSTRDHVGFILLVSLTRAGPQAHLFALMQVADGLQVRSRVASALGTRLVFDLVVFSSSSHQVLSEFLIGLYVVL